MTNKKKYKDKDSAVDTTKDKVKFEVYGEEMIEKRVSLSGEVAGYIFPLIGVVIMLK